MAILFVAGTDTGVGKTEVTCALLDWMGARGARVLGIKPVETGVDGGTDGDGERLCRLQPGREPGEVNPLRLREALTPADAARAEGRSLFLPTLVDWLKGKEAQEGGLLLESAGGVASPLAEGWDNARLAAVLGAEVLLVGRAGLGGISALVTAALYLQEAGVRPAGFLLNRNRPHPAAEVQSTLRWSLRQTGLPLFGLLPNRTERQQALLRLTPGGRRFLEAWIARGNGKSRPG